MTVGASCKLAVPEQNPASVSVLVCQNSYPDDLIESLQQPLGLQGCQSLRKGLKVSFVTLQNQGSVPFLR